MDKPNQACQFFVSFTGEAPDYLQERLPVASQLLMGERRALFGCARYGAALSKAFQW